MGAISIIIHMCSLLCPRTKKTQPNYGKNRELQNTQT